MGKINTIIDTVIKQGSSSLTGILHKSILHSQKHNYKNSSPDGLDIKDLVECCREEIGRSEIKDEIPQPEYFEKVADYSRHANMTENEIAICEMYIDLVYKYALKKDYTESKIKDEVKPLCNPFMKRIRELKAKAA